MTYFRTGNPYYHRRAAVSRSCSGWEGVVPAGYGRQALTVAARGIAGDKDAVAGLGGAAWKVRGWVERYWRDSQLWSQAARAISTG